MQITFNTQEVHALRQLAQENKTTASKLVIDTILLYLPTLFECGHTDTFEQAKTCPVCKLKMSARLREYSVKGLEKKGTESDGNV